MTLSYFSISQHSTVDTQFSSGKFPLFQSDSVRYKLGCTCTCLNNLHSNIHKHVRITQPFKFPHVHITICTPTVSADSNGATVVMWFTEDVLRFATESIHSLFTNR